MIMIINTTSTAATKSNSLKKKINSDSEVILLDPFCSK